MRLLLRRGLSTLKPRFNYQDIVTNTSYHTHNAHLRKANNADAVDVANKHKELVEQEQQLNELRRKRNTLAKSKTAVPEEGRKLKALIASQENIVRELQDQLLSGARLLPNRTHPSVAPGDGGSVIRRSQQNPREFDFSPKDHVELGTRLELFDFGAAAKMSGARFALLKNQAVMLELNLKLWVLQKLISKGFTAMSPPEMVHESILEGCGFQPRGESTQIYRVQSDSKHHLDDLCLIGTSEIPLAASLMDTIVDEAALPIRLAGVSSCFRAEAGSAGKKNKGLFRLHQFGKVEMFTFCTPEQSEEEHEKLLSIQEEIADELGLQWRTLDMNAEELGSSAYRKYDVEAWMPGRGDYGEIASISNCTDYQSRRLNIRYRSTDPAKKNQFVHTLNGTACATSRTMLALLETHQDENGDIPLPAALQNHMQSVTLTPPKT